jgi:hypothetical protein
VIYLQYPVVPYIQSSQVHYDVDDRRPQQLRTRSSRAFKFWIYCCYVELYEQIKRVYMPVQILHVLIFQNGGATLFATSRNSSACRNVRFDHSETHRSAGLRFRGSHTFALTRTKQTHSNNLTRRTWWIHSSQPSLGLDSITLLITYIEPIINLSTSLFQSSSKNGK